MELHNVMEDIVIDLTNSLMKKNPDICDCDRCQLDIVALTLNKIQPKYVVSSKGELYQKANMMTNQNDADLVKEITKSIDIVGANPRHQ